VDRRDFPDQLVQPDIQEEKVEMHKEEKHDEAWALR
jgi:hypothetical protein